MLLKLLYAALVGALLLPGVAAYPKPTRVIRDHIALNPSEGDTHPLRAARRAMAVPIPRWLAASSDPSAQRPRGATRVARRASPSDPPGTSASGAIAVTNEAGSFLGYVKPAQNSFGEYGQLTSDKSAALIVTVTTGGLRDMTQSQGVGGFPNIGGIVGFASTNDNLISGSYNYAFIGSVDQTARFSPPVTGSNSFTTATGIAKKIESSIWNYDATSGAITAQWINTDSSQPATTIVYANDNNNAFVLTADAAVFRSAFGANFPIVTFTLEP